MNCSGCRYVAVIDGSSHCAAPSCIKDEHIVEQYDEKKELTARIAELERKNAMLVDALRKAKPIVDKYEKAYAFDVSSVIGDCTVIRKSVSDALSATSDDTEVWIQAEIVKRLGEPAVKGKPLGRTGLPVADDWVEYYESRGCPYGRSETLYRLPSPLATPEERIKEGRI